MWKQKDNNKALGAVVVQRNLWHTCVNTSLTQRLFCCHSSCVEWPHWLLPCLCLGYCYSVFLTVILNVKPPNIDLIKLFVWHVAPHVTLILFADLCVAYLCLGSAAADQVTLGGRGGGGARWFWSDGLGATTTSPPWEQRGEVRANERQLSFLWSQHATANVMRETSGADQWQINTRNMRVTHSHRNSRVFSTGLCSLVLGTSIFDTALHRWYIWKCRGLCVDRCTMSFLKTSRLMKGPLDFHLLSTAEVFFCKPRSSVSHAFF